MHEEDNAVPKDLVLKHLNYEKIEMVPPSLHREIQERTHTRPTLSKAARRYSWEQMWSGGESGLKVGVNLLFFPCSLLRVH